MGVRQGGGVGRAHLRGQAVHTVGRGLESSHQPLSHEPGERHRGTSGTSTLKTQPSQATPFLLLAVTEVILWDL